MRNLTLPLIFWSRGMKPEGAILKAMDDAGDKLDLSKVKMYPCVVPERGTGGQTMDAALAILNDLVGRNRPPEKKPKWKFW